MNVQQLADSYAAVRLASLAPKTIITQKAQIRWVVAYFGGDTDIATVTPEAASGLVAFMRQQTCLRSKTAKVDPTPISASTAGWIADMGRRIFAYAVRAGYLATSPFAEVKIRRGSQRGHKTYIAPGDFDAVLASMVHPRDRRFLALLRYGGLRVSEALAVRWRDLNLEVGLMHVQGKKGADGEYRPRQTPIQPSLRRWLTEGDEGHQPDDLVCGKLHPQNVFARLKPAFSKAGVDMFPRLFHSLRASLVSDWQAKYPPMDVCSWLGHSIIIAASNYHQALTPSVRAVVAGDK
jgi:integrase